jgi:hypothetical protein
VIAVLLENEARITKSSKELQSYRENNYFIQFQK